MTSLFISYSHDNSEFTQNLAETLQGHGYAVWTDITGISGGAIWGAEITRAIHGCDVFVVIVSSASNMSSWVEKEILLALNVEKLVVPVVIEDVELHLPLLNIQPINYFRSPERALEQLLEALPPPGIVELQMDGPQFSSASKKREAHTVLSGMNLVELRRLLAHYVKKEWSK